MCSKTAQYAPGGFSNFCDALCQPVAHVLFCSVCRHVIPVSECLLVVYPAHLAPYPEGRLKTGTPPRLDGTTIAWTDLDQQPGDATPQPFAFAPASRPGGPGFEPWTPPSQQIFCYATRTTAATEALIVAAPRSKYEAGAEGVGASPRYCPSLETKVQRFPNRTHLVWLEPEGLDTDVVGTRARALRV